MTLGGQISRSLVASLCRAYPDSIGQELVPTITKTKLALVAESTQRKGPAEYIVVTIQVGSQEYLKSSSVKSYISKYQIVPYPTCDHVKGLHAIAAHHQRNRGVKRLEFIRTKHHCRGNIIPIAR